MVFQKFIFCLLLFCTPLTILSQKLGFKEVVEKNPDLKIPFSLQNNDLNKSFLEKEGIIIKRETDNWLYITESPQWISKNIADKKINDFYFEYAPPSLLDDSARVMHDVDPVHSGDFPLLESYTGKGVIIGIVDAGLDHRHPDFTDIYGNNRVIRYWDHSVTNPTASPAPYNYGQIWYANQIQNGTITSNEESGGHGSSVTGICAGNGLANGRNKGMAPETQIIFVETNFNLPNWTLTVADACDYIFSVADSLNKPAVINLSVGSYLGSHDGEDPAAELMDLLLSEKNGRIIICAAGNSGNTEDYHAQQTMTVADTNFIWFENNPSGSLGNNSVFFDLWSDVNDAQFKYSFGANRPSPSYGDAAETVFRFAQLNVGTPIFDTLFNDNGERIATLEIYTEYVAGNYHLQGLFSKVDSTDYLMRFSTTGLGKYDLWSGAWIGLNKIVKTIPTVVDYPPIVNYVLPDNAQSIVSSWNCSPNVISVANLRGRLGHITNAGTQYYPGSDMTPPGNISPTSSRGPSRAGVIKPDISAAGDVTLGSAPLFMVGNSSYDTQLGIGGFHLRNGGTSMASPVVAGIAALYLERCKNSSSAEFMADLFGTAESDAATGTTPNNRFGYGKVNAFDLLTSKNGNLQILGDTAICQTPVQLAANIPMISYEWSTGSFSQEITVPQPATISLFGRDLQGCKIYSDTVSVVQGSPLQNPTIQKLGNSLVSSNAPNYQWYLNDSPINGATEQTYTPLGIGYYSVAIQGADNCKSFSNAIQWTLNLKEEDKSVITLYPNPAQNSFFIEVEGTMIKRFEITSTTGQIINNQKTNSDKIKVDISSLSSGAYLIKIETSSGSKVLPFFKE
ncbi:T9SS type A sorting domain-containing protein [Brumimicrobium glaciale]|uniref:T9SS type A sorting domain-containing protein n=1 Tax=Brumimicrobium glaciale TaxID=200475 RepID=A0A4Q4KGU3_9FLAO|nr:S8/S53 family peptidase [Brumimicrobium glaciale]RYM32315.1 T9SS type A sorting domain-containing protein [Brumimicrobium glaciale]